MENKRGSEKYYIIISMILGLIILTISLFFIFQEYFTQDTLDIEACRQSVFLRANAPEIDIEGFNLATFKDKFPLKCKTNVVDITEKDLKANRSGKIIGEAMVQCWAMFDNGDAKIFPNSNYATSLDTGYCMPCARIHLTEDAKKYLGENKKVIDIEKILRTGVFRNVPYLNYLRDVGKINSAFSIANSKPFNLDGDSFLSDGRDKTRDEFLNKLNDKSTTDPRYEMGTINLPKIFNPSEGDLLVIFVQRDMPLLRGSIGMEAVSSLIYFQVDQKLDPFEMVRSLDSDTIISSKGPLCEFWDGIPA